MRVVIGTLNEGSLHAALKSWYANPGDLIEHPVDGYVIDLVREELLIEVQTGGFAPLRTKLENLMSRHRVRIVAPVPQLRTIVRVTEEGEVLGRRRSPKKGRFEDIFARLVSFPTLIDDPRFELDVLLTAEDEVRVHRPGEARRRKGWVVLGRSLVEVTDHRTLRSSTDLAQFLPTDLPDAFSTADLARSAAIPRRLAQQMAYCLRAAGVVAIAGKEGNSLLYRRGA